MRRKVEVVPCAILFAVLCGLTARAEESTDVARPVPAVGEQNVAARVALLETELAALRAEMAAQKESVAACCPPPALDACGNPSVNPCAEPETVTDIYGNVYLQWRSRQTGLNLVGSQRFSDLDIYWGELGFTAQNDDWSGKFSILLDDSDNVVKVNEAWAKWQRQDDPLFVQTGRILVPFGNNTYYFPTYPAVNDLGYSTLKGIGLGYDRPETSISAYLYNSSRDAAGADNTMQDYTVAWDVSRQVADECRDGWEFTVGYNSNLAAHDLNLGGLTNPASKVPGYNVFGRYDFHAGDGLWHVLADYTKAAKRYAATDLDADADGVGDQPSALNTELVFERDGDLWGVNYQFTDEMADYAGHRWGLLYGTRLDPLTMLKFEYTHGQFGDFATAGQDGEDTLVAEVNLAF